jgi:hypothetical protein
LGGKKRRESPLGTRVRVTKTTALPDSSASPLEASRMTTLELRSFSLRVGKGLEGLASGFEDYRMTRRGAGPLDSGSSPEGHERGEGEGFRNDETARTTLRVGGLNGKRAALFSVFLRINPQYSGHI